MNDKINTDLSIKFRGRILHDISAMEIVMNMYIARFFCGNSSEKIGNMQVLILGDERMTLKSKIDVFVYIAKTYNSEWYKSYSGIKKELKLDLIHAMEQRNIFAHRIITLYPPDDFDYENTVRFMKFKNSLDYDDYTTDKFDELSEMIQNITVFIHSTLDQPLSKVYKKRE